MNSNGLSGSQSDLYASLEPLFRPKNIAIIGASSTPFKQGNVSLKYLAQGGYQGGVFPVNPSGGEIEGLKCYESIGAIDRQVDCALFVIPAAAAIPAIKECAAKGVKAAIIGANGFAELGTEEGIARQNELTQIAREHGIRIVGPNTNGIWNATDNLSLGYNKSHGDEMTPGPVSIAAHSGALFNSIAPSLRRFGVGLSKFIPVGNEADLDMLDFLEYFIEDPATRIIGLVVEALRDGPRLRDLSRRTHAAGKHIVALKLGRSAAGAGAALAHSSRLAGNARAYDALFKAAGVWQVPSIEAMAGACALLSSNLPRLPQDKRGLICVTSSGAGGGLVADHASDFKIPLAGNPDGSWAGTAADLIKTFDRAGPIFNPIDGGNLAGWPRLEQIFEALEADGYIGPVLFFGHMLPQERQDKAVQEILMRRKQRTGAPIVCVAPGGLRPAIEVAYGEAAIPVFNDLATCFMGLRCLYDAMDFDVDAAIRPVQAAGLTASMSDAVAAAIKAGEPGAMLSETQSAQILSSAGVSIVESHSVTDADAAITAAETIGWPLVLKGLAPGVAHKNDAGLVITGIRDEAQLRRAYGDVQDRLLKFGNGEIILQSMLSSKAELIIGVTLEPPLGHFLVVGLGGIYAEILDEVLLFPVPSSEEFMKERIEARRIGALLKHLAASADAHPGLLASLIENLLALQNLLSHFGDHITSIDVNPLLVREDGCIGVDALVELN